MKRGYLVGKPRFIMQIQMHLKLLRFVFINSQFKTNKYRELYFSPWAFQWNWVATIYGFLLPYLFIFLFPYFSPEIQNFCILPRVTNRIRFLLNPKNKKKMKKDWLIEWMLNVICGELKGKQIISSIGVFFFNKKPETPRKTTKIETEKG